VRLRPAETFADHYSQARLFFRSQTAPEQAHLASAIVFELSKLRHRPMSATASWAISRMSIPTSLSAWLTVLGVDLPAASEPASKPYDMDDSARPAHHRANIPIR
jgi:catalase